MVKRWPTAPRQCRPVLEPSSASAIPSLQFLTRPPVSLLSRFVLLSVLFTVELVPLTIWLDGQALLGRSGLLTILGYSGSWLLRGLVAFAALFATFAVVRDRNALREVSNELREVEPVSARYLAGHIGMLALFGALS